MRKSLINKLEKKILFLVEENKQYRNHGLWNNYQNNCIKIKNIREEIFNNRVMVKQLEKPTESE